jgi:hypothetical protein
MQREDDYENDNEHETIEEWKRCPRSTSFVPFTIIRGAVIHTGVKTRNVIYTRLIRQLHKQSDETFLSIAIAP